MPTERAATEATTTTKIMKEGSQKHAGSYTTRPELQISSPCSWKHQLQTRRAKSCSKLQNEFSVIFYHMNCVQDKEWLQAEITGGRSPPCKVTKPSSVNQHPIEKSTLQELQTLWWCSWQTCAWAIIAVHYGSWTGPWSPRWPWCAFLSNFPKGNYSIL